MRLTNKLPLTCNDAALNHSHVPRWREGYVRESYPQAGFEIIVFESFINKFPLHSAGGAGV